MGLPVPRVVVVGGGISGLALAYRLQERRPDLDIAVLEAGDRPGGNVGTLRRDGFQAETGPNGFLDGKPATMSLCRDLGLGARLVPASLEAAQNRYLFLGGRLRLLPGGLTQFLRSDLLSWRGKASLIMERWRPPRRADADESIAAFARRRAGAEAAEVFADALVTGIYAGDPRLLSVRACFPRLANLEREHGSVMKGLARAARARRRQASPVPSAGPGKMWSLSDGLAGMIEALCAHLRRPPLAGVRVLSVRKQENAWVVSAGGKDAWHAEAVVLACPAYQQAGILAEVDEELAGQVEAIPYNRIAVVALGYRRADVPGSVAGFGFIAPQRLGRDILGVQWCSSIFPGRAPPDMVLLRALAGGWNRADVPGWDDGRLVAAVRAELRLAQGICAVPVFQHIFRWNRAIPQYLLGHLERVAWIEARARRYPGLFLAGNAYHGVALNDCTEQAGLVAEKIDDYLRTLTPDSIPSTPSCNSA
jgi:oxygen-dependent protoporphyrinogen oxidase